MNSREYVEDMILARLTRTRTTDLPDSIVEHQFKAALPGIEIVISKILRKTSIRSFSDEDLRSFMLLKAHQMLRQGKWDRRKSVHSLFYTAFSNLMYDIIRAQGRKKVTLFMHFDVFDMDSPLEFMEHRYNPEFEEAELA
jgi:DNA-directed RNA polymerase specialized sigma24 family protein